MIQKNSKDSVRIIPIGGLNEIGKNMTLIEHKNEMIMVDCGLSFPDDEMLGIDIVISDFTYVIENKHKLKAIILTHGHEDHIGALPYLLKKVNAPIYGTALTVGLVKNKFKEHNINAKFKTIKSGSKFRVHSFMVEAIRMTHSIADAVGFYIEVGGFKIFHTGDFKIDYTPIDGEPIDLARLAHIGAKGVDLLLADSTNALRAGFTESEKVVGEALEDVFRKVKNSRILVATFSSNVHRIQKIIDNAIKFNRKVAVSGRSMVNVFTLAKELGYLKVDDKNIVDIKHTRNIPDKNLLIITTGSQGEPMSALSRIANSTHRMVQLKKGDVVVLSSTPVPGNEKTVSNVVNTLLKKGAEVIYSDISDIHVSGHACREELKLLHTLLKPKYFMPVHGEYSHLKAHVNLAEGLGLSKNNIFILDNGDALNLNNKKPFIQKEVAASESILVDGLGVGDVGNVVLKDRKLLSESGIIVVTMGIDRIAKEIISGPEIISRGFVYVKENEDIILKTQELARDTVERLLRKNVSDKNELRNQTRDSIRNFVYQKTKRNPMILPIFLDF